MATIINRLEYKQRYNNCNQGLFILFNEKRFPKGQSVVNLGVALSEKLYLLPLEERINSVTSILFSLIQPYAAVSLTHIELLFTDYLRLDVIRTLLSMCRNRKICLVWPGEQMDNRLIYATPNMPEYYECDITSLQDTYIVTE